MTLTKCHQCHVNAPWRDGVCLDCLMDDEDAELAPHPPPLVPTAELPGTAGKIEVLAERYRLGYALWHQDDAVSAMRSGTKTMPWSMRTLPCRWPSSAG